MRQQNHPRLLLILVIVLLVACGSTTPNQPTPLASVAATSSAATVAKAFIDALNQSDYANAFKLLDEPSQQTLRDAESLRNEYAAFLATTNALSSTLQLRGVLQEKDQANAALVTYWGSSSADSFVITSTLPMNLINGNWQVAWSRDVLVPGLAIGTLSLERIPIPRGAILASDGSPLAEQSELVSLGIRRDQIASITEENDMLAVLSTITTLPADQIKKRYIDQPANWFVPIAEVTSEVLQENEAKLQPFKAVLARRSAVRHYPQPQVAPHLVGWVGLITPELLDRYRQRGYTGDERVGLSGIEASADDLLAGTPGTRLMLSGSAGSTTVVAERSFVRGVDVTLTISPNLQLATQRLLGERRGAAIVLNVKDGGVLAMASYPTFDPQVFVQPDQSDERTRLLNASDKPLLNRAAQSIYPPGSSFKMVTMAASMHEGVAQPNDEFTDPGWWDGLGKDLRKYCWKRSGHGQLNFVQGLSASCNVVFYTVGAELDKKGQDLLPTYARQFGFGARTGIEISGEAAGLVPDPEWKLKTQGDGWATGDTVNMAIGQGFVLVTPLQVAQMTAAIANGGTLHHPHLIAKVGEVPFAPTTPPTQLPVSNVELSAIQTGMRGVIDDAKFGTAHFRFSTLDAYLQVDGRAVPAQSLSREQRGNAIKLSIAGKSGTAQTGGADELPYAWFTAYVPADDPQIAITVLLENIGEGSVYAAPIVRQIIETYYGLPLSATPTDRRVSD